MLAAIDEGEVVTGNASGRYVDVSDDMPRIRRVRLVGINHVELDVGSVEAALVFYGRIFELRLRARTEDAAFIDLGDQFLVFRKAQGGGLQRAGHFGLVVEQRSSAVALMRAAGAIVLVDPFPGLLDPWGNRVEIVDYARVTFLKAPLFQQRMNLSLSKMIGPPSAEELA